MLAIAGMKRWFAENPGSTGCAGTALSGANVNFARLRHIAERATVGEEQEALLGVTIPERPGSLDEIPPRPGERLEIRAENSLFRLVISENFVG